MKEQVAEIVAAYVRKNRVDASALPDLIASVSRSLESLGQEPTQHSAPPTPAVPIRRSVSAASITCLDCGWSGQILKRHLSSTHGLTVDAYRARWGLPHGYSFVAKNHSARRSDLGKSLWLGRRTARER